MASKKVTITLPAELVARSTELAKRAGLPLSTWLARAAEHQARIEDGLAAMREWEAEEGALTPEELAWADAEIARADAALLSTERAAG
jgi:predicted transcriptional regulator